VPPLNRDASALYFPPEAFGPFRILHQIGAGTLGPVFRAYEPDRDRLVAIKVFRIDVTPDRQERLAQALAFLVETGPIHPSAATPIRAGAEAGVVYLAQEYAVGESLDVALGGRRVVRAVEALALLEPLAGAIDAAALHGLNHGLLHPRDVVITPEGPVVTGFGVARALLEAGVPLPARRGYSAPEISAGEDWDVRADVFALGVVARELMFGRGSAAEEEIEPALADILRRGTAVSPSGRFPKACSFVEAVRSTFELEDRPDVNNQGRVEADARQLPSGQVLSASPEPEPSEGQVPRAAAPHASGIEEARPVLVEPSVCRERQIAVPDVPREPAEQPAQFADTQVAAGVPAAPGLSLSGAQALPVGDAEATARWKTPDEPAFEIRTDSAVEEPAPFEFQFLSEPDDDRDNPRGPSPASLGQDWPITASERCSEEGDRSARGQKPLESAGTAPEAGPRYSRYQKPVVPEVLRAHRLNRSRKRALVAAVGIGLIVVTAFLVRGLRFRSEPAAATPPAGTVLPERNAPPEPTAESAAPPRRPAGLTAGAGAPSKTPAPATSSPAARVGAPAAATAKAGRLQVRSRPTGARVIVNGSARGLTPLTLHELPLGSYTIRIERDGYAPDERSVRLTAARAAATLTVPLKRQPASPAVEASGRGSLVVETRPTGARVFVDGRLAGTAPISIPDLPAGPVAVRIEQEGFQSWTSIVRIAAGERSRVGASLVRSEGQ